MKYLTCVMSFSCLLEAYEQFGWRGVVASAVVGYIAAHIFYHYLTKKAEGLNNV